MGTNWPDLTRTRAALATFDEGATARALLLYAAATNKDVTDWVAAEGAAWGLVTDAFALDTADRNSKDQAKLVDEVTLRAWVSKAPWRTF